MISAARKSADREWLNKWIQGFEFSDEGTVQSSGENDLIIGANGSDPAMFGKFDLAEVLLFDQGLSNDWLLMTEVTCPQVGNQLNHSFPPLQKQPSCL